MPTSRPWSQHPWKAVDIKANQMGASCSTHTARGTGRYCTSTPNFAEVVPCKVTIMAIRHPLVPEIIISLLHVVFTF